MQPPDETSAVLLDRLKRLYPTVIELSLGRLEALLVKLGNPHLRLPPVVHVAGTNGKGSTCAFMASILTAAGYGVHWYSSPHLVTFHERIRLAAGTGFPAPISDAALIDCLQRVERANAGGPITFFEITTAAAFLAFAAHPADLVILEVGLGGRFDATNVIPRPELTVITPVSIDHAEYLGSTLALIAREKAGILKRGRTAVIAAQPDEAFVSIQTAASPLRAPLWVQGQDFDAFEQNGRMVFQSESTFLDLPKPALLGRHQIANAGVAIAAVQHLAGFDIPEAALERGLLTVQWPARMQRLQQGRLAAAVSPLTELWLDGGHNPAGGQVIAQTLADLEERAPKPLVLIVGMMGSKDITGFLTAFASLARHLIAVPVPATGNEPPMPPERVVETAAALKIPATRAGSIREALAEAERLTREPRRVLICGSLHLAGHVLALDGV